VCIDLCVAKIVDGNNLDRVFLPALVMGPQDIAPDAAIAVDRDSNRHRKFSVMNMKRERVAPRG
jgi:hypothetical protein